jgi:nucleoside-diphosphate-sugar epimerase
MARYFVTGATGFIGGRLLRQLVAGGHQVSTVARTPSKAADLAALGVEIHQGDITAKDTLHEPMRGAEGVFHVAGWYKVGVKDKSPGEAINVDGTRNVLEVMKELGIPKGVYTSTLAVFGDTGGKVPDETFYQGGPWLSEYDRTKWKAHYEVAVPMIKDGLPLVIVQPGLVYGQGDTSNVHTTLVSYLKRQLPVAPQKTAYCWAHVDDTAQGHILAMEKGRLGESYIIAGPVYTLIEALAIIEKIAGIKGPRIRPAPWLMNMMGAMMTPLNAVMTLPETYTPEGLRSIAGVTYLGSNEKAKRELGFAPRTLEEGMPETLVWEKVQLGMKS